jgi:hypothetical protein
VTGTLEKKKITNKVKHIFFQERYEVPPAQEAVDDNEEFDPATGHEEQVT